MPSPHSPAARARRHALVLALVALVACLPASSAWAQSYGTGSAGASVDPGSLLGWGLNNNAQLGNATTIDTSAPIPLAPGREFVQVRSGDKHTVALASDGSVWTWGQNTFGKLGDGTIVGSDTPVKVPTLANIVSVAAGEDHTMALRNDGAVFAWGDSTRGQVGFVSSNPVLTPTAVLQQGVAIAAGVDTSMAITRDGAVWAWGENANGQLALNPALVGNGFRNQPQKLSTFAIGGANGPARAIAQGCGSSYVLDQDGDVWAFGSDQYGQVEPTGASPTVDFVPDPIPDFSDQPITSITAGCGFAGAVDSSGDPWTWGRADDGRLGTGAATNSAPAKPIVADGDGVDLLSAAEGSMLAISYPGRLYAWGDDAVGTLGNHPPLSDATSPVAVASLGNGVAGVGTGADGQQAFVIAQPYANVLVNALEFGTTSAVGGKTPWKSVTVSNEGEDDLTLKISEISGDADEFEIVGDGCTNEPFGGACTFYVRFAPVTNGPASAYLFIEADGPQNHSLVRLEGFATGFSSLASPAGPVFAWGANDAGQIGDLSLIQRNQPVRGPGDAVALATGERTSFALRKDGTVWAWGSGDPFSTLLGPNQLTQSLSPVRVEGINAVEAIAAGGEHTLALRTDGTVWGWGLGTSGQIGHNPVVNLVSPALPANGVRNVVDIAAGGAHSLAVRRDGAVYAFGSNSDGQVADNVAVGSNGLNPKVIANGAPGFTDIVDVAAGAAHSVALGGDGTVWTWGSDSAGQLGNGLPTADNPVPTAVAGITDAIAITAGEEHTVVLLRDGTVRAFGAGTQGQLGDGPAADSHLPVVVKTGAADLAGVIEIAAGRDHTVARHAAGNVVAWGDGVNGVIGDNSAPVDATFATNTAVIDHGGGPLGGGPVARHVLMAGQSHMALTSPGKMVFPASPPGGITDALTAIVRNDGLAPMTMGKAELVASGAGPDADQFKITGDGCSGRTLAPQEACHVGVRFTPIVTVPLVPATPVAIPVAHLRIPSDAPNSPMMVEVDPPAPSARASASRDAAAAPSPAGAAAAPSAAAAAVTKAAAAKRASATCAKARAGKRTVRLSCRVAGAAKGRTLSVWLKRGRTVYASGRAKVSGGRADVRLKARRRVRRGVYTATVRLDGGGQARSVQTLRVTVR